MALPTLLDIAKRNGTDAIVGLIDEAARQTPELAGYVESRGKKIVIPNLGAARTIKGRQYKTLIRTALPTVGFRNANQGAAASKSQHENKLIETYILNPRWECDKAVAQSEEDGPEAYITDEAIAMTTAALMALAKQFYYGTVADSKGHPGLLASLDASLVVDATGTTPDTGSSLWAVKFGPKNVQWVYGEKGSLDMGDVREESITDGSGNRFTAYVQEMLAYPGVQVGSKYSIGRIKKLTEENGKGLTDALIAKLIAKFPVGVVPDALLCSRRSLEQLRASRTATNALGTPAPTPTEWEGIPIIPSDSIMDTESLAL